jgi:DNA (cytosine-5)-methyltransferase 1
MNYNWLLRDTIFTKDKGKVFTCFSGGGGSSLGYKLAGFDVIGCNEIDKRMMDVYIANHNPKYSFLESISTLKVRDDLPKELYDLDILEGSPPCSAFSMAGQREENWGKEKKFREGQVSQVLDTLFFDFIDLAKKLQPKIVIAENVKGLLQGQAKEYVKKIYQEFNNAGYNCDHYLLNASNMGVPQKRERVFFIAYRKDLPFSHFHLNLDFNEKPITFGEFYQKGVNDRKVSTGKMFEYWQNRRNGDANFADTIMRVEGKHRCFNNYYLYQNKVCNTYTSNDDVLFLFDEYRKPNKSESCCIGSFPQDYNFVKEKYNYVIGMSVPPLMIAKISKEIYDKWLKI